ncbi:MAG: hypothetical protein HY319_02840 [Armatimonadetes bacterium]|nr:hypothetical protein [Armatimonadota bacterium]
MRIHRLSDPVSRPGKVDDPGQVARGLFVVGGPNHLQSFHQLATYLERAPAVDKTQLLEAVDFLEREWSGRPEGEDRERALIRLGDDRKALQASAETDLAGVARGLRERADQRCRRLENLALVGLGVACAAALTYISPALGLALPRGVQLLAGGAFLPAVIPACVALSMKERPPQLEQAGRLLVYAEQVQQRASIRDLADALAAEPGNSIEVGDEAVRVGGVWVPKRTV